MTDKEKIKAEVERLKKEISIGLSAYDSGYENGKYEMCEKILSFINSMQEEPVSGTLEKAARKYAGIPEDSPHDLKYCVQDKKAKYDAVLYGANLQKQQMMKDAVDAIPCCIMGKEIIYTDLPKGIEVGDEAKVIIIKDE